MSWLWAAISGMFSGLAQGFLALFGMSDQQKLGRAQVENKDLAAALKEKEYEAKVFSAPARPESAVDDELRRHADK
jgi:hypothetical protein